jgi:putative SOS response-associated peptidase YedK
LWKGDRRAFVATIHDRMPVVLEARDFDQWEHGSVSEAAALIKPASEDALQAWPVSQQVNSSRASDDDASLIESITPPEEPTLIC